MRYGSLPALLTFLILSSFINSSGAESASPRVFVEWKLPDPYGYPEDIVVSDDEVIFGTRGGVAKLDPAQNLLMIWQTGPVDGRIAYQARGIVWSKSGSTIQRLETESGSLTEWSSGIFTRSGLIMVSDNSLWFLSAVVIARLDPRSNDVTTWQKPIIGMPSGIAMDARGNLWFTANDAHRVGRLSSQNNTLTQWFLPPVGYWPEAVIVGPDESIWFLAHRRPMLSPSGIYKLSPWKDEVSFWIVPRLTTAIFSRIIVSGPGEIWFTIPFGGGIAKLRPSDNRTIEKVRATVETVQPTKLSLTPRVREVTLTSATLIPGVSSAEVIQENGLVEWIAPRGKLYGDDRYRDVQSRPSGIAIDVSGDIWFTDRDTNKVSKLTTKVGSEPGSQALTPGWGHMAVLALIVTLLFLVKTRRRNQRA